MNRFDTRNIKKFLNDNRWIIAASVFFVAWKLFLVHTVLQSQMAVSSDALLYIKHIDSITSCRFLIFCKEFALSFQNYFGFEHLSYRLFFGIIGKLLGLDATETFQASFYIGIALLLPTLLFFVTRISKDKNHIAIMIFFLALYNGGSYHGFFWVVPSFFATLLIFLIFGIILEADKNWKIFLAILVPTAVYTHTISLYLMVPIVIFFCIHSFISEGFDRETFKRIVFMIAMILISYLPVSFYLGGNPFGPQNMLNASGISQAQNVEASSTAERTSRLFPGMLEIRKSYFDILFFKPFFIFVFAYTIALLWYYKEFKILSMYFAVILFTLLSSINENGLRSLILTWPITYIMYAYATWLSFRLVDEKVLSGKVRWLLKSGIFAGLIVFVALNGLYSYFLDRDGLTNLQKLFHI